MKPRLLLIAAVAAAMLAAPSISCAATLYDQTDNESSEAEDITSPGNEIADDFVVPAGVRWTIDNIGSGIGGVDFSDMTVTFYADDGPGNEPMVAGNLASSAADTSGNLASAVTLDSGHYWVGITATGTVVGWPTRAVQSNSKAVADTGTDCTRWSVLQDCEVGSPGPDMSFSINGTSAATGAPAGNPGSGAVAGTTVSAPSKTKKCKKKHRIAAAAKACKKKKG